MYELYKEQGVDNLTHAFLRNIKLFRESDYHLITNRPWRLPPPPQRMKNEAAVGAIRSFRFMV